MLRKMRKKYKVFQKKNPELFEFLNTQAICACILIMIACSLMVGVMSSIKTITVNIDDATHKIKTLDNNIIEAVNKAGITWNWHDSAEITSNNTEYMINVTRSFPVTLTVGGEEYYKYVSTKSSVQDLLAYNDIELSDSDNLNFPLTEKLTANMSVVIDRVTYDEYTVKKEIPFTTKKISVMYMQASGVPKNIEGKPGSRIITKRDTIVNGVVTKTTIISDIVEKKAVDAVEYITLKAPEKVIDGKSLNYKKLVNMSAVSYTAKPGSFTSSGKKAQYGAVAINPKFNSELKMGDKLYIETSDGKFVYGYAEVCDIGSFSGDKTIDLFLPSTEDCRKFGRRDVKVYVLN